MVILNKRQFKKLITENPTKRFLFLEWTPEVFISDFHITDGNPKYPGFGATTLSGRNSEDFIFDYDWSIDEYTDDDRFAVLEDKEILEIINLFKECLHEG